MGKLKVISFVFYLVASFSLMSQQKDTTRASLMSSQETEFVVTLPDGVKWLKSGWLFNSEDKKEFAQKDLVDSTWIKTLTGLKDEESAKINYKGFGWFRYHLKIDSGKINIPHVLHITQNGASEIYIDGVLEKKFGVISQRYEDEVRINPGANGIYLPLKETGEYVIAIRYSNTNYKESYSSSGVKFGGFEMYLSTAEYHNFQNVKSLENKAVYGWGLFVFFLTISIVHLLLFVFYPAKRSNFFFAIFCLIFGYFFLYYYLIGLVVEDVDKVFWLNLILALSFPLFFSSFQSVLYSLFFDKFPKRFKVILIISVICSACFFYNTILGFLTTLVLMLIVTVDSIRFFIQINKERKKGALLITFGFGFFILFIALCFLKIATTGTLNISGDAPVEQLLFILFGLGLICIPLSMSASLAWDFAQTNKALSRKLIEVEELSVRSIEQEKEKQKILAGQNVMLEKQVKERTSEIEEQKKLIEEKNKDITDSINYAQRIQRSILPTEKEIKEIFTDSFVLFKPRDIVSGDFYQFKKVGTHCFSILADCTGHGVPGALMSMIGSNLLNQIIVERKILDPSKILSELSKEVRSTLRQTSGAPSHDGMDAAVTLWMNDKLFIASANRPVFIIQNGILTEIKPTKNSIGGSTSSDSTVFEITELSIHAGMMVYMFSDGYADQFGGEAGKKFKIKKLTEMLLNIHQLPLDEQHTQLNVTFENWKNNLEQVDDVCLIGLRF